MCSDADIPKSKSSIVVTDFSKAFDRINNIVISHLLELGACPSVIPWVWSFLKERSQCVQYKNCTTEYIYTIKAEVGTDRRHVGCIPEVLASPTMVSTGREPGFWLSAMYPQTTEFHSMRCCWLIEGRPAFTHTARKHYPIWVNFSFWTKMSNGKRK